MDTKERLLLFIKSKGISQATFEKSCGLSNGYVNNIRVSISDKTLQKIALCYPEINPVWLKMGKGEMLTSDNTTSSVCVIPQCETLPVIPMSARGSRFDNFLVNIMNEECERILSPIRGGDFVITVTGDSMAPDYPNGSQLIVKKIVDDTFIEWGKVYVLDTINGVLIKRVLKGPKPSILRCSSYSEDPSFAPFNVRMCDVYGIYRVIMLIALK
jgi:phage repressor protein C with HTH and peptisase S24 domain